MSLLSTYLSALKTKELPVKYDPTMHEVGESYTIYNPDGSIKKAGSWRIDKPGYVKPAPLTDKNKGIFDGVRIGVPGSKGAYATNPDHLTGISNIYNNLPDLNDPVVLDAHIREKAPKSPITSKMILDTAAKYGVSPGLLVTVMRQDSGLGTVGKGAKSFNPGNVGNDDTGRIVNYGNWSAGVDAVGRNLSKRKVQ